MKIKSVKLLKFYLIAKKEIILSAELNLIHLKWITKCWWMQRKHYVRIGDFANVKIDSVEEFDLFGTVIPD